MRQGGQPTQFESRIDAGGQVLLSVHRHNQSQANTGAMAAGKVATLTLRALAQPKTTQIQVLTLAPQGEAASPLIPSPTQPLQFAVTP